MGKFKAIIFDMDGVVVDTDWIWDRAFELLFKEHALDFDAQKVRAQVFGLRGLETLERLIELYDLPNTPQVLHNRRMELMDDLYETEARFVTGFLDFKDKLREYPIQTAVATNAYKSSLAKFDSRLKLSEIFAGRIYSVDSLDLNPKPQPDIYLYAVDALALMPEDCIAIEDSVAGIQAAKRAGLFTIALANSYQADYLKENSKADLVVDHFSGIDLAKLL